MSTRRALLAAVGVVPVLHISRTEQDQSLSHSYPHPDAALLALSAQLERMQAEWQRLWLLTSDGANLETEADHAWQAYSDTVWPGIAVSDHQLQRLPPTDLPGKLRILRATTPEGLRAKARAVMALDNAAFYCDCRNDAAQIWESVIAYGAVSPLQPHTLIGLKAKARVVMSGLQMQEPISIGDTVEDSAEWQVLGAWHLLKDVLALGAVA